MASEPQRAKWREHNRRRRAAAAKEGICSRCLARRVMKGRSACKVCHAKIAGKVVTA